MLIWIHKSIIKAEGGEGGRGGQVNRMAIIILYTIIMNLYCNISNNNYNNHYYNAGLLN